MNIIHESYQRLFPEQEFPYQTYIEYNRRLADFNANIRLHQNTLSLHLNLQWKDIDEEIKIGLVQNLLLRVLKKKINTLNIDLYHNFIRNIPTLMPKTRNDAVLESSFQRINSQFFQNQVEQPNLQWGQDSFRKLASYNFHDDTITVSTVFTDSKPEILDFLMYHEMLHKSHKFSHRNGRSSFHSPEFKEAEHAYPEHEHIEKEINAIIRQKRKGKGWWGRFF